jgi:hypothetical protein
MIRQVLPNNNERCYSNFSATFREVNTPYILYDVAELLLKFQKKKGIEGSCCSAGKACCRIVLVTLTKTSGKTCTSEAQTYTTTTCCIKLYDSCIYNCLKSQELNDEGKVP